MGTIIHATSASNLLGMEPPQKNTYIGYAYFSRYPLLRAFLQKRVYNSALRALMPLLLLINLTACGGWYGYTAVSLDMTPPDGPEIYKQAWLDGCKTGVAANTNDFYKIFARIKQDPEGMKQEIYRRVWQDAYNYCWFHTSTGFTQPI